MTIGPTTPTSSDAAYAEILKKMDRRLGELERRRRPINLVVAGTLTLGSTLISFQPPTVLAPACAFGGSILNVISSGTWWRFGDWIDAVVQFRLTGAPAAGDFTATLPVPVNASDTIIGGVVTNLTIGQASVHQTGVYFGSTPRCYVGNGSNSTVKVDVSAGGTSWDNMRQLAPWTWKSGDAGSLLLRYRV